jgi:hypothetical protein
MDLLAFSVYGGFLFRYRYAREIAHSGVGPSQFVKQARLSGVGISGQRNFYIFRHLPLDNFIKRDQERSGI